MSGIPNQQLPFEPQAFVAYRTPLEDAGGSRWLIEVMGQPETCERFLSEGGFRIELIPLEKQAQPARATAQRRKSRASNKLIGETQVRRGVQFGMTINLLEARIQRPSVIKFEIDPVITEGSSPHGYWLNLNDDTDAPSIVCTPTRGNVVMSLYGAGNFWSAYVYWLAGNPAEYTLRGDIVRF
jgi:hypothetical protein